MCIRDRDQWGYTKTSCRIVVYPLYQVDRYRVGDRITDGVIPDRTMENAVCIPATTDCLDIYRSSFYPVSYTHLLATISWRLLLVAQIRRISMSMGLLEPIRVICRLWIAAGSLD